MNRTSLALGALLLALPAFFGCKKPEPPPPTAPVEKAPEPGREYSDANRQRQYEDAWHRYYSAFEAPSAGDYVWVRLSAGSFAGGELKSWSSSEIVLRDGTNEITVTRGEIDKDGQYRVFADAFARRQALAEIEEALTPRVDRSGAEPLVGTVRYSIADSIIPRTGPGDRFQRAVVPEFKRGDMLDVIDQDGPWIKVTLRGSDTSFWLNGLATRPIPNSPPEDTSAIIKQLLNRDLLRDYDPLQSTAHIPRGIWIGTHPAVREGLSRVLAENSAKVRNSPTAWIEIKDSETGRRLARYSTSQGFRQ